MLVRGEAVQQEAVPLHMAGGAGCSLAWLAQPPAVVAGQTASLLVETRDAAGQRIQHVSPHKLPKHIQHGKCPNEKIRK